MIKCVSISNCTQFTQNLIQEQHRLRYREVIEKERWDNVYVMNGMEFDQYDNLATEYFIAHDERGVLGVTRTYPTTLPYMLSNSFSHLFDTQIPASSKVFEASRLVLDRSKLSKEERMPVINELLIAYMERGLQLGIEGYVGFMLPKIWDSTFIRIGWNVEWLGKEHILPETGDVIRAAFIPVNKELDRNIRMKLGMPESIIDFGNEENQLIPNHAFRSEALNFEELKVA